MTSFWTAEHVARIADGPIAEAPVIAREQVSPLLPRYDLWDFWPVQEQDGRVARIDGGELMMLLSAPAEADPEARHARARIRLMHKRGDDWADLGPLLPDGFAPGSREWAGSAIIDQDHRNLTLYFTAAGVRGEAEPSFDQRLFETRASLAPGPRLSGWSEPVESIARDGRIYQSDLVGGGAIGTIKAFRDPAYFRDAADGSEHLVFAASLAGSASPWNGAVGHAARLDGRWTLQPPLIAADGVNNELERPHLVAAAGLYYLFWSTQAKVFASGGPTGPNGLYGMVADRFAGPYRPINGSGLVFANPSAAPFQAYSWLVLDDLRVLGFADNVGLNRLPAGPAEARAHFGGTPAPELQLRLQGDRAWLA